jgi:hypothetical protein
MLQPRYAHALVAQGGCLYALGGQASKAIHRCAVTRLGAGAAQASHASSRSSSCVHAPHCRAAAAALHPVAAGPLRYLMRSVAAGRPWALSWVWSASMLLPAHWAAAWWCWEG